MTADISSSGAWESPSCDFEPYPQYSALDFKNGREVHIEQLDEQLFFDYFRQHVESSCRGKLLDSNRDRMFPATSSGTQQENLPLSDAPERVDIKTRKEELNVSGRNFENLLLMKFSNTCRCESLGFDYVARPEKPKDNATSRDEACSEGQQNCVDLVNVDGEMASLNAPEFHELCLEKDPDRSACLENGITQEKIKSDLISESKIANFKHSLETVCPEEDLLENLSEIDEITNKCLKNIYSKIGNMFNSSLQAEENELRTMCSKRRVCKDSNILPTSSNAEVSDSGLHGLKTQHAIDSAFETAFTDAIRKSDTETNKRISDYSLTKQIAENKETENENILQENGNAKKICFECESNQHEKCESRTDFKCQGMEDQSFTNAAVDFKQLREFDPLLSEQFTLQSSSAITFSEIDTASKITNWNYLPIKEKIETDIRVRYTRKAKEKLMENWIPKPPEKRQNFLCSKNSSTALDKEQPEVSIFPEENLPYVKGAWARQWDKFDAKECFKTDDLRDENCKNQKLVVSEDSGSHKEGSQWVEYFLNPTVSTVNPGSNFGAKEECLTFQNLEDKECEKQEFVGNRTAISYEILKSEESVTSDSTSVGNIIEGTVNTKQEAEDINLASQNQSSEKTNNAVFNNVSSDTSILPYDGIKENELEESGVQNSDAVDKCASKWTQSFHSLMIFGTCPDCKETQSGKGDVKCHSSRKSSTKDVQLQAYYKDRRCRSKSKRSHESKKKTLNFSKKAGVGLKRVTFIEDNSIFCYDPDESIAESFWQNAQKLAKRTSRSSDKLAKLSDDKQPSLEMMICKPPKKNDELAWDGGKFLLGHKQQGIFQKTVEERVTVYRKEMKGQASGMEQRNQGKASASETFKSDVEDVLDIKDAGGFVNAAFEDVPIFDTIPDLERTKSASVSATFDEDEKLLSGERTSAADKSNAIPVTLTEMSRHAECSMKRWIRDGLLARKRLSFKKMKSALLKK